MKKIAILGANGLLGQSLLSKLAGHFEVIAASKSEKKKFTKPDVSYHAVDITNRSAVSQLFASIKPDVVINTAAYTHVDDAEKDAEKCWAVNVHAVENIIDNITNFKPVFVHISTDYVFNGRSGSYKEDDETNPLGNYGRSKLASENIVSSSSLEYIIARTQLLYGFAENVKLNFATWVISRLSQEKPIRVVSDQIGNPTYVDDLSESISRLIEREEYGLFNISGSQAASRFDFAKKIAEVFKLDENLIEKINTEELKQIAPRPMDSTFNINKLVNRIDWEPGDVMSGLQRLKIKLNSYNG